MNSQHLLPFPAFKANYHYSQQEQQQLLDIQQAILEMVAGNFSEADILNRLCLMAEQLLNNSIASIMLTQPEGHMDIAYAPSVPIEGQRSLNGLVPSQFGGSCGNAVYRNKQVFVQDALNDDRCRDTFSAFKVAGICACWSTPIRDTHGTAIGSFALSSFEVRAPREFHKSLLAISGHIASIVLLKSAQQTKLEKMAFYDSLTGVYNRNFLFKQLNTSIENATENNTGFAVIFIDLDRFKSLNDTYGHIVGDQVLKDVAERTLSVIPPEATLSRVGGDEFVVIVHSNELTVATELAQEINTLIGQPFVVNNTLFELGSSAGIAQFPRQGENAEELLKNADIAMYKSKLMGGGSYCIYEASFAAETSRKFLLQQHLRHAIDNDELTVYFQPQVDAKHKHCKGFEALLRWNNESLGAVSPDEFIPIAESTGLINPIGLWVVSAAIDAYLALHDVIENSVVLAVNLSSVQLTRSHVNEIISLICDSAVPNHLIELEVTELCLIDEKTGLQYLEKFREKGIRLAIDDFGAGYSSLNYLKTLCVTTVKIDRFLISDIADNADDIVIVEAIVNMVHTLGLSVVAEGVETKEQADLLAKMGCDTLQGYYFGHPQPTDELSL